MNSVKADFKRGNFVVSKADCGTLNERKFGVLSAQGLVLSSFETLYLIEKGWIQAEKSSKKLGFDAVSKLLKIPNHEYLVFKDLRSKGCLVKSGLKYGFLFRVYEKGSSLHAKWLVDAVKESEKTSYKVLAGKSRVAHSTKKQVLMAVVDSEEGISYFELGWKRI
ncbi:MAG: tRNA-intron lyase [Nanoarchaeota archaeon]